MSDCPKCGMRDDDWFLCRRNDCATKATPLNDYAALEARYEEERASSLAREEALRAEIDNLRARIEREPVVQALEWEEYWSGGNEDIPAWRARNSLGLHISFSFAGRLFDGRQIKSHDEAPKAEVQAAKDAKQADYARRILSALASAPEPVEAAPFQQRVQPWMMACFGAQISADQLERGDRFIEEALELLQSGGYPRERVQSLINYVYSRAIGDPAQEVGGVMVTLAAYCLAHNLDMHACGETELSRAWTKVEKIRAKQAAKPTGSALPIAYPPSPTVTEACKFRLGERVTKTKGSSWTGRVVGFYSTALTPAGCCVESETETGSVQLYPEAALASTEADNG